MAAARWQVVVLLATWGAWRGAAQLVEPPRCPDVGRCALGNYGQNEYPYTVDGSKLLIEYTDSGYFALKCSENVTLDNSALPRFTSELRVSKVQLKECPPPRDSYARVLAKLNVVALDKLKLVGPGALAARHLAGLPRLPALELSDAALAPGALAELRGLARLFLDNVSLPRDELLRLPARLQMLELMRMGLELPAAALERLPHLVNVTVREPRSVPVALGGAVRVLALEMPGARVPGALSPALRSLTVFGWDGEAPVPWSNCSLELLELRDATARLLPDGWLRECAALRVLRVSDAARLRQLGGAALHGAAELRELQVSACALTALPPHLLDDAKHLSRLDLSRNFLMTLPGGLFAATKSLQTLNLSRNRLNSTVFDSLQAVTSLTSLSLSYNDLKDSCGGASIGIRGSSKLQYLKQLTKLYLRKTNTSMICRDWHEMPLLEVLDLADNDITNVTFTDLRFRASVKLNLSGNNVTRLVYTRGDYLVATSRDEPPSRADVTMGATLACDCHSYWAARALQRRDHVRLRVACRGGARLRDVPPDQLLCPAPALCERASPACACAVRPRGPAPPRPAPPAVLRVTCERAGLAQLSDVLRPLRAAMRAANESPDDFDWQLYLAHNRIANLSDVDLPKYLSVLDVRNNSLSTLSEAAARALTAPTAAADEAEPRRVWLAHNPLSCECGAAGTLAVLRAQPGALADYYNATCADRSPLAAAAVRPCAAPRGLGAGAAAGAAALLVLLAGAALAGLLCHPALRLRLKAALHRRGWLPAAPEEDDDECRFDVFVSFSHGDERFVREQLLARLEGGPAPYRVCVHYRDWAPGGWIPAQIAASVRASRRTLAVVSAHFLRSAWARHEFQEAYALALRHARPRLVVLLLEEPGALPLDARLRRYLASNTYVRWGDPYFWDKLQLALPRARGPAPSPAPSGLSAAAPVELEQLVAPTCGAQYSAEEPRLTPALHV